MDESVDKKLTARFQEVFDRHEDDGAAEGWALLQSKRPQRKPVPFYWLSGAAALLLLAGGLFWFGNKENATEKRQEKEQLAEKQKEPHRRQAIAEQKTEWASAEKSSIKEAGKNASELAGMKNNRRKAMPGKVPSPEKSRVKEAAGFSAPVPDESLPASHLPAAGFMIAGNSPVINSGDVHTADLLPARSISAGQKTSAKEAYPKVKPATGNSRVFALAVYAGSQVNYGVQNTRRQARPTAGLQAEFALGKAKRFSVGLSAGFADYQLAYNNGLPPVSPSGSANQASTADRSVSLYRAPSAPQKRIPSFVKGNSLGNPALQTASFVSTASVDVDRVTANFTAVELPLAVSWKALTGKTGLSISAAVNSTWMIREAYSASLSINSFRGTVVQTRTERSEKNFTAFTPFSAAQVSVGVSPGGARSRLSVEPFARFPLQNQGMEQLKFGAAGLNLRFRLNAPGQHGLRAGKKPAL